MKKTTMKTTNYQKRNFNSVPLRSNTTDEKDYSKCLQTANQRYKKGELKICPRGYCSAKDKFEVYPSAYANGYASQVCNGKKPDVNGLVKKDVFSIKKNTTKDTTKETTKAMTKATTSKKSTFVKSSLDRWFKEKWVNVCEKNKSKEGYKDCGRNVNSKKSTDYPYCRPFYHLNKNAPISVSEIIETAPTLNLNVDEIFSSMCTLKRNITTNHDSKNSKKPTYINFEEKYPSLVRKIKRKRVSL